MIGSNEADPWRAQQIIMKEEVVSLTFWLRHVIFIPSSALITSCFSHYLLSVLKSKRVWQPLEIPISSITAHLRTTRWMWKLDIGEKEKAEERKGAAHLRCHPVRGGSRDKRAFSGGEGGWGALTWRLQHNRPVCREELLSLKSLYLGWQRCYQALVPLNVRPHEAWESHTLPPQQLKCKLQETKKYIFLHVKLNHLLTAWLWWQMINVTVLMKRGITLPDEAGNYMFRMQIHSRPLY